MLWFVLVGCTGPVAGPSMSSPPGPDPAPEVPVAAAPTPDADPEGACDVRVYVGPGVGPTELFDAPAGTLRGTYAVLEPLRGGISAGPILQITRSAGDGVWFEVGAVEDYTLDEGAPARGPASGWVRRSGLEVDLTMSAVSPALMEPPPVHLREAPATDAPIVRTYLQEAHTAEVLDCTGGWLKVRVVLTDDGSSAEGWLAPGQHCGHPFTTCG
ncbi:MAG: SH3 domain-containing protein [Myxococcota bacterium]